MLQVDGPVLVTTAYMGEGGRPMHTRSSCKVVPVFSVFFCMRGGCPSCVVAVVGVEFFWSDGKRSTGLLPYLWGMETLFGRGILHRPYVARGAKALVTDLWTSTFLANGSVELDPPKA